MPQPATHYWVARTAIPETIENSSVNYWKDWWDKYKSYFGLGTSSPDLFYFPLMPFTKADCENFHWEGVASILHSAGSYDFFCTLLDAAKQKKKVNIEEANRQFAFAFGYYAHVITDCIFHPYVYRSTGDHWATTPSILMEKESKREYAHKYQEFLIDQGIYKELNVSNSASLDRVSWVCSNDNDQLLDPCIANTFYQALIKIYPDCMPADFSDPTNEHHPIQQAYFALLETADTLFKGEKIICFGKQQSFAISDIVRLVGDLKHAKEFFNNPYPDCGSLDPYTPKELFNFACAVARRVFIESIEFYNDSSVQSSKDFFDEHTTHFLRYGNWNLDTGLLCQFNNTKELHSGNKEMDKAQLKYLKDTYQTYQGEYNILFNK